MVFNVEAEAATLVRGDGGDGGQGGGGGNYSSAPQPVALDLRSPRKLAHFERRFNELSQNPGQGAAVAAAWAWLAEDCATSHQLALMTKDHTAELEAAREEQLEAQRRVRWQQKMEQQQRRLLRAATARRLLRAAAADAVAVDAAAAAGGGGGALSGEE